MKVVHVPILSDNYGYLLIDENNKIAAAVDPADPHKIRDTADSLGVKIDTILTTHHHSDHSAGNIELVKLLGGNIRVVGGNDDRIPGLNFRTVHGSEFTVGEITVKVLFTPCHTNSHVLYLANYKSQSSVLFTGDTLFIAGCGRFFEGTAEQMYNALIKTVGELKDDTLIYCGHEYTEKNLKFAETIEPDNIAIKDKLTWAKKMRSSDNPTVPSTIVEEKSYNPFMRVNEPDLAKAILMEGKSPIEIMAELRKRKDNF